jgi:preprotein translocase subunit SecD
LRVRLDIATRPVRVEVERRYRILVTVCHTTTPEDDRRLLQVGGAVTIVPLPRAQYGSRTSPGPAALPGVGEPVDPALRPLTPAVRLGISRAHVDPGNGRRGVAFRLANEPESVYRAFASGHLGEFVAIVLDGLVMAVLPIEGPTADGVFAFTGDYSEAEARHLAEILQVDPMQASLREIRHVEIPSTSS